MKFIRVGSWVLNAGLISCIEVLDSGGLKIWFYGPEALVLEPRDGRALLATLAPLDAFRR